MEELNESFDKWLNEIYHQRKHTSTGQSPLQRFAAHMKCIRTTPENLGDYFRKVARRRVARDRTITLDGRLYEAPVPLIGKQVTVLYHDYERVEVTLQGKSYGFLVPVNLDAFVKSRISLMCHFDQREKSCLFNRLQNKDFSFHSK